MEQIDEKPTGPKKIISTKGPKGDAVTLVLYDTFS